MKQFSCGDIVPNCEARFDAETEDEILTLVAVHARDDHGLDPVPDDIVIQVRGHIHDVA